MRELALDERLLTARQVAGMLGVSTETVLRWTRAGKLPAIRLPGGAIRYRPSALEHWLADRETSAPRVVTLDVARGPWDDRHANDSGGGR